MTALSRNWSSTGMASSLAMPRMSSSGVPATLRSSRVVRSTYFLTSGGVSCSSR